MRLPLGDADEQALDSAQLFRHAKAEDKRLIKELFGGPCFEGTLQKLPVPYGTRLPNEVPWPGQLRESRPLRNLRCQTRTRVAEKRPASHTNALGSLFIADECKFVQQIFQRYKSL